MLAIAIAHSTQAVSTAEIQEPAIHDSDLPNIIALLLQSTKRQNPTAHQELAPSEKLSFVPVLRKLLRQVPPRYFRQLSGCANRVDL